MKILSQALAACLAGVIVSAVADYVPPTTCHSSTAEYPPVTPENRGV